MNILGGITGGIGFVVGRTSAALKITSTLNFENDTPKRCWVEDHPNKT